MLFGVLYSYPTCYKQIVSALWYLNSTRTDICYIVNKVYQFMHASTDAYWIIVKCILHYLNAMTSHGLQITSSLTFSLHWFIDVDCDGSVDDCKSTSYYLVYLGTTPISWKFMKQKIIALSFTKTKYKALGDDIIEV